MLLRLAIALIAALLPAVPAGAQSHELLARAHADAVASFERARRQFGDTLFEVDLGAYRDALVRRRFNSAYWGGRIAVDFVIDDAATGSCARFAAFVRLPPRDGRLALVLCPQFFSPDADGLRRLTMLHEMVHVVAGPDECRAMAFAAAIEQAAHGYFTPVDAYWRAHGCAASGYRLPR
jgi:hypothetical protein